MTQDKTLVIDTPEGIQAYRYIATLHGLRMELKNTELGFPVSACPTRGRALESARHILNEHDRLTGWGIKRKEALRRMEQLCEELGLTKQPEETP